MATIYIENQPWEVNPKHNLLHECLSLGFDLPYFCWHPALGSVGACRQCAVKQFKNEEDHTGKLIMACMTPASDGARISIRDPEAANFRAAVIQGLMLNHPHDCPVCDEGGECHLQDVTVMSGHRMRGYEFEKRTFRNQDLGPHINHEMNRCIQCQRCVRYYREYAGGDDLNAFRLRNVVYFGRAEDGTLESEFSGNLVEICPTGVFTDATLKHHYTRKWDLQMAPSVCVHCGVGCNTTPGERYGTLRRIINRYNGEVNGYFLCDRGRFGYEFVNSNERIHDPLLNGTPVNKQQALQQLGGILSNGRTIGIGSPRASLEDNFALRTLVGPDHFFSGMSDTESDLVSKILHILRTGPAKAPSLHEIEGSDAVLILGEDVTNTAPLMALRLRQSVRHASLRIAEKLNIPLWLDHAVREAAQDAKSPLFVASPYATKLDDIVTATERASPDEIARLGFAIAHLIDPTAPAVPDLSESTAALAQQIAEALQKAERPLIISGMSCQNHAVIEAAAQVAWALCKADRPATLSFIMPECNSVGLGLLEAPPLSEAFHAKADTVIILENDLFRRAPADKISQFLNMARHVVALDFLRNATTEHSELVFPSGTFAEADGTLVNNEGRAQRFVQVFIPSGEVQEGWRWIREMAAAAGDDAEANWHDLDDVIAAMADTIPALANVRNVAPLHTTVGKIPREPNRYSGRTSNLANITVHEPKPPEDPDSPLAFSMESGPQPAPSSLIPFFWAPGWNSIQSTNKFQSEVGGALRGGDPGVRLIESTPEATWHYCSEMPAPFRQKPGEWLLVPCAHLFGSEELSIHSPGIAQLAPKPYIALNSQDADKLGVHAGDPLRIQVNHSTLELPVMLRPELPDGIALLPVGLPSLEYLALPASGKLAPVTAGATLSMRGSS